MRTRLMACLLLALFQSQLNAQRTVSFLRDTPVYLLPDASRQPLLVAAKDSTADVVAIEGAWVRVSFDDSRNERRVGYVQSKFVMVITEAPKTSPAPATPEAARVSASSPPRASEPSAPLVTTSSAQASQVTTSAGPAPTEAASVPRGAAKPIALRDVRRIYIEKMPHELDQYITAEIVKEKAFKGRVSVVLDKANADAILRGVGENRTGVGAAITGRYFGLHDNANATVTLVDSSETTILWASEAGDRSLWLGALARGGQRKVADRLVNNLKKALELK